MSSPANQRYSIAKSANNARPNGVLAVPAMAIQKRGPTNTSSISTKSALPRLKVVIRRLPPGLTQAELEAAIGDDWKVGGGKVDWSNYKLGKVSKDPAKPSRPARIYLHLTKQEYLGELSEKVKNTQFDDAKASGADPTLLGPPSVEFAPYGRTPSGRVRKDARQSTIDQDPEFIDFLESLTNPTIKPLPGEGGSDAETKKVDKPTVTPLIQFLRDKKANKGKETSPAKPSNYIRSDSKDSKSSQVFEKKVPTKNMKDLVPPVEKRSAQAIKVEKAARDAVRLLNKQAPSGQKSTSPASSPVATPTTLVPQASSPSPLAEKKRERGNASAAARILQRDLGIASSPPGRRGGRRDTPGLRTQAGNGLSNAKADATVAESSNLAVKGSTTSVPDTASVAMPVLSSSPLAPVVKTTNPQPPTGPAASRSMPRSTVPSNSVPPTQSRPQVSTPARPTPLLSTATQAFLKHANPSQGINEALLEEGFASFGAITKVEIDKKKGFAYIEFAKPEGLQNAIKASPVKIAQGQVVVLERKTSPTLQARNARGGAMAGSHGGSIPMNRRGGRGGSMRGVRGGIGRGGIALPGIGVRSITQAANPSNQTNDQDQPTSSIAADATVISSAAPSTASAVPVTVASTSTPSPDTSKV